MRAKVWEILMTPREKQIFDACKSDAGSTRTQIASALGLKVHPALINEIESLVQSGDLEKRQAAGIGKRPAPFFYRATHE